MLFYILLRLFKRLFYTIIQVQVGCKTGKALSLHSKRSYKVAHQLNICISYK